MDDMIAAKKLFSRKTVERAALLLIVLVLAGCGGNGSDDKKAVPTPQRITLTPLPTGTRTPIPTWTPSNTPTPPNTPTPGPTFTPRPSASPTPQPVTGAQRSGQDRTIVTVLEADLNISIANTYQARGLASLPVAPTISLRHEGWLEIQFTFRNEFSGAESQVNTVARLSVRDGQLLMSEIPTERSISGAMLDEESVTMTLDLILQGINDIVVNLVPAPVGTYEIASASSYPGFLQVIVNQ